MTEDLTKLSLLNRVREYYRDNDLTDGNGKKLNPLEFAELASGVVSVLDDLGEIDIFFDVGMWEVADEAQSPYDRYLDGVRKNALQNAQERYRMTCIAESVWNPLYRKSTVSFIDSLTAAKAYLKPKWNEHPIISQ